jgi:hypothetical protein
MSSALSISPLADLARGQAGSKTKTGTGLQQFEAIGSRCPGRPEHGSEQNTPDMKGIHDYADKIRRASGRISFPGQED